jgi:lactate permease
VTIFKRWVPYLLRGLILVLTRIRSLPFVMLALQSIPLFKMKKVQVRTAWGEAIKRMKNPLIALVFAVPMTIVGLLVGIMGLVMVYSLSGSLI